MSEESLWSLISRTLSTAGGIERAVFFLLAAFSLASWALVLIKFQEVYAARKNGVKFRALLNSADSFGSVLAASVTLGESPLLKVFRAAMASLEFRRPAAAQVRAAGDPRQIPVRPATTPEDMLRLDMQQAASAEISRLQSGLGFLATTGSTSPFIGLFGTVWGIMSTFRDLGSAKSASLAVVAPGLSSALIATAAGLAVAIPAVMAYNWLLAQIDGLQDSSDALIDQLAVVVRASGYLEPDAAAGHSHPAYPVHLTAVQRGVPSQIAPAMGTQA